MTLPFSATRGGAEDSGKGIPIPRLVRITNISAIPQGVGFADFRAGETREVTQEQASYLLTLPYFKTEHEAMLLRQGSANTRPGATATASPELVRELRHALWPDPTQEDWVRALNDGCFPCQTTEFDPVAPTEDPKTICFRCAGLTQLNGGTRVILRLAAHLAKRGHAVTLSAPEAAFAPDALSDIPVKFHVGLQVPDADFVVGTFWPTILEVERAPVLGRRVALLQGDEPAWPTMGHRDLAARAFSLEGVRYVAICQALAETCRAKYGTPNPSWLPGNGVDSFDFSPRINNFESRNALCFIYRNVYWKGDLEAVTAGRLMQEALPNFRVAAVGFERWSYAGVEYTTQPDLEQMAMLYSSSDFYVSFSRFEGSPLPPLEAMACGCIPVVTPIGVGDYLRDGENGFLVEADNPRGAVEIMLSVLQDERRRRAVLQNGLRTARERSWCGVAEAFENLLLDA